MGPVSYIREQEGLGLETWRITTITNVEEGPQAKALPSVLCIEKLVISDAWHFQKELVPAFHPCQPLHDTASPLVLNDQIGTKRISSLRPSITFKPSSELVSLATWLRG